MNAGDKSPGPRPRRFRVRVEPGTHWWCTCGKSDFLPFCDGSHKGSGLQPLRIVVTETEVLEGGPDAPPDRHPEAPP